MKLQWKFTLMVMVGLIVITLAGCYPNKPILPEPIATSTGVPTTVIRPAPTITPTLPPPFEIRLAWFYKPPDGGDLSQLAQKFGFFILSKGDEVERDQLIALNVRRPILQYVRFDVIQDPGSCTEQPWRNQVAFLPGDFCKISRDHPDWFLLDQKGQRIINPYGGKNFVMMDPGNQGWRTFFLERVRQTQADANWDGVFLDNVEVSLEFRQERNELPAAYPDEASYRAAIQGFLEYLHANYFQPDNRLLFANLVARRDEADFPNFLTYLDGAMHEGWAIDNPDKYRSVRTWEKQMVLAEQTQALGKFIILVSQGTRENETLQRFAFASYLLINNGLAAFRYGNSRSYREVWLYDNYSLDLGQPLGPRYRDGDAWRRDFTNGTVMVNPTTHEVVINSNQ